MTYMAVQFGDEVRRSARPSSSRFAGSSADPGSALSKSMIADEEEPEATLIFFWFCCDRDLQAACKPSGEALMVFCSFARRADEERPEKGLRVFWLASIVVLQLTESVWMFDVRRGPQNRKTARHGTAPMQLNKTASRKK